MKQFNGVSISVPPLDGGRRLTLGGAGTLMIHDTAYHVSTMTIGPGIQSLAWAMAQLGWIGGPPMMIVVAIAAYYTVTLQVAAYNYLNSGTSNYSYTDVVRGANLGGVHVILYGIVQCLNLLGTAVSYNIASSMAMKAIWNVSSSHLMIGFGVVHIFLSQINNIDKKRWFIVVTAGMSFTYPIIGVGLAIANIIKNGEIGGSLTGIRVTETQKMWKFFQALGVMAFSFSCVLNSFNNQINEIESPASRDEMKKKATRISVIIASVFKIVYGNIGYAAFGDTSPENLLSGNTFWPADIANAAIVIHVVGAYQVFCQPLFASIGEIAGEWFPHSPYIAKEITLRIPGFNRIKLNLLSLLSRAIFVILTTTISMLFPFFNYIIGIIGAVKFFALAVYFPVQIHIALNKIPKCSSKWVGLHLLITACFALSVVAVAGSVAGIVSRL